jgi:hypothetical protein
MITITAKAKAASAPMPVESGAASVPALRIQKVATFKAVI